MYRASTPTHRFVLPNEIDTENIDEIIVTYAQCSRTVLEKREEDVIVGEHDIHFRLTQREANLFKPGNVALQIRIKMLDGTVIVSNIYQIPVREVLNDEEM